MQIPLIRLQQTYAAIGISRTPPQQEISQPRAELNLEQQTAELTIDRTPSKLEIDQSKARSEVGLKGVLEMTSEAADRGRQYALEGIARRAGEGTRLAGIDKGGDPIVEMAREKASPGPAEFNIGFIPSYGSVKINFTPAQLDIHWKLGGVSINPELKKPIHEYTPGKTEVYLRQKQSLSIDFVGGALDQML